MAMLWVRGKYFVRLHVGFPDNDWEFHFGKNAYESKNCEIESNASVSHNQ